MKVGRNIECNFSFKYLSLSEVNFFSGSSASERSELYTCDVLLPGFVGSNDSSSSVVKIA
jgi:hypothetical protein